MSYESSVSVSGDILDAYMTEIGDERYDINNKRYNTEDTLYKQLYGSIPSNTARKEEFNGRGMFHPYKNTESSLMDTMTLQNGALRPDRYVSENDINKLEMFSPQSSQSSHQPVSARRPQQEPFCPYNASCPMQSMQQHPSLQSIQHPQSSQCTQPVSSNSNNMVIAGVTVDMNKMLLFILLIILIAVCLSIKSMCQKNEMLLMILKDMIMLSRPVPH